MLAKIKKHFGKLDDPRTWGLMAFVVIVLLVSWSGAKAVQLNYELQKQIATLQQQNDIQSLENENLRLRNQYFETDQYLELTARRVFGKSAPGEKLLLIPKEVALKHTVEPPSKEDAAQKQSATQKPWYQRNLEAWRDFLLHLES